MKKLIVGVMAALSLGLFACGPTAVSQPVGIDLAVNGGDAVGGTLVDDKDVTTETGNPYAVFVKDAQDKLGGSLPGRIEVKSATLLLGAGSTATALDQVFAPGEVQILFVTNTTKTSYPVGSIQDVSGPGPLSIDSSFSSDTMPTQDKTDLLNGSFKVEIRGPANPTFVSDKGKANLQVTFQFAAYS